MDPLYLALSLYRRRRYDKCIEVCSSILDKQPLDQATWCLKMRALTQRVSHLFFISVVIKFTLGLCG